MNASAKSADAMLEAAARLRHYARETGMARYRNYFNRGAGDLELEAVGCAAFGAVARAMRDLHSRQWMEEPPC